MNRPSLDHSDLDSNSDDDTPSMTMRSGTGAPIFDHGATTRIRRNPSRAIAAMTWDDGPRAVYGQVVNVSLTGCLVRTESTIDVGTEVHLSISVVGNGDDSDYEIDARICRTTDVDGRRAYGVEFCADSKDQRTAVQALYSATANQ